MLGFFLLWHILTYSNIHTYIESDEEKKKDQIHDVEFNYLNIASPILIITIIIIQDAIIVKSSTNPVNNQRHHPKYGIPDQPWSLNPK